MAIIKQTGQILLCIIVLFPVLVGSSHAQPSDPHAGHVQIRIRAGSTKEALRTAYIKGMVLGYIPGRYDMEEGILHLYREEYYGPLLISLHIKVELTRDEVPPLLTFHGEELTYTGEEFQVRSDMDRIAATVRGCCGAGDGKR